MKKHKLAVFLFFAFVLSSSGCEKIAFMDDGKKNDNDPIIVTPVEDPQLAKLILKPSLKSIEIPRDPFKPIYGATVKPSDTKKIEPIRTTFTDVYFIGMVKMDNQAIALLKVGEKKIMLKLNEQYRGFMVKEIENNQIIFSNGENQITLKRGAKK